MERLGFVSVCVCVCVCLCVCVWMGDTHAWIGLVLSVCVAVWASPQLSNQHLILTPVASKQALAERLQITMPRPGAVSLTAVMKTTEVKNHSHSLAC